MKDDRHIDLQKFKDNDGQIVIAEKLPFEIKRTFCLWLSKGNVRGMHAMKRCNEIFVPITGKLQLRVENSDGLKKHIMYKPERGILVKPEEWRILRSITPVSICLVLASELYDPDDYIRNYKEFQDAIQQS